jgi:hypothetical protein
MPGLALISMDGISVCRMGVFMEPRISFVTLGVEDLERSSLSWAGPGLPSIPGTCSPLNAGVPNQGSSFPRFALAHNVRSTAEADRAVDYRSASVG